MTDSDKDKDYSEKEAQNRFEAALKGAMNTSPKPLKEKPKAKRKTSTAKKNVADR